MKVALPQPSFAITTRSGPTGSEKAYTQPESGPRYGHHDPDATRKQGTARSEHLRSEPADLQRSSSAPRWPARAAPPTAPHELPAPACRWQLTPIRIEIHGVLRLPSMPRVHAWAGWNLLDLRKLIGSTGRALREHP